MSAREEAGVRSDDARVEQRGCLQSGKEGIGREKRRRGAQADAESAVVAGVGAALVVRLTQEVSVMVFPVIMRCEAFDAAACVMAAADGDMTGRCASNDGRHCAPGGKQERKQHHQQDVEFPHGTDFIVFV